MGDNPYPEDGPRKPAYEAPCNGCGLCCVATPCGMALEFVAGAQVGEPCPALEWEGGRSWCGMVRRPDAYAPAIAGVVEDLEPELRQGVVHQIGDRALLSLGSGVCDSGTYTGDPWRGQTAAQFHRERPVLTEEEALIVRLGMLLRPAV